MFKDVLSEIERDLNNHKRTREEILNADVQERLNRSLQVYYKELSTSLLFLSVKKDKKRMMRRINRMFWEGDK